MAAETFSSEALSSLRVEGGIVSPSIIAQAAKKSLDSQAPADYGLPPDGSLEDAIGAAHKDASSAWERMSLALEDDGKFSDWWLNPERNKYEPMLLKKILASFGFSCQNAPQTISSDGESSWCWGEDIPIYLSPAGVALDERYADPDEMDSHGKPAKSRSAYERAQDICNRRTDIEWALAMDRRTIRFVRDNRTLTRPAFLEIDLEIALSRRGASEFKALWLFCHASRFKGKSGTCVMDSWIAKGQKEGERALDHVAEGIRDAIEALGDGFLDHRKNESLRERLASGEMSAKTYYSQLLRLAYRLIFLAVAEERSDEEGTPLIFRSRKPEEETEEAYKAKVDAYLGGISLSRLRSFAWRAIGSDGHDDLWKSLLLAFRCFEQGEERLAILPLGGLFSAGQCPDLEACSLSNSHLLKAVESMTQFLDGKAIRLVNWRDIGAEEIGGIYERLLGLSPVISLEEERKFRLTSGVKGNERKISASYYTPSSLVNILADQALAPKIAECEDPATAKISSDAPLSKGLAEKYNEVNLLGIRFCDPACGSGHFLLAGARMIANAVARARCGGSAPTVSAYRQALHDVATRCVFGVDKNPMAIELAKTALWLESYARNRPLSFVDHHLLIGDALTGSLSAKTLSHGIPGDAYKVLEGDDKELCSETKKRNSQFLKDLEALFLSATVVAPAKGGGKSKAAKKPKASAIGSDPRVAILLAALSAEGKTTLSDSIAALAERRLAEFHAASEAEKLDHIPDQSIENIQDKSAMLDKMRAIAINSPIQRAMDIFSAAFLCPKSDPNTPIPTSEDLLFALAFSESDLQAHPIPALEVAEAIREEYSLLHWPIAFPTVFMIHNQAPLNPRVSGFDVVLGNPPWEKIKIAEKEWFAGKIPEISEAATQKRRAMISDLSNGSIVEQDIHRQFQRDKASAERTLSYCLNSGRFPLTGKGDLNLYSAFAETAISLIHSTGKAGIVVPTGVATDDSGKALFSHIANGNLISLFDFLNVKYLFDIAPLIKFSLLTMGRTADPAKAAFYLTDPVQAEDPSRVFEMSPSDISLMNPNTGTTPLFRSAKDAEICRKMYQAAPVLWLEEREDNLGNVIRPESNPWKMKFMNMFHMSNDSHLFLEDPTKGTDPLPLYESKLMHLYDHRFATFDPSQQENLSAPAADKKARHCAEAEKANPSFEITPRYWVEKTEVDSVLSKAGWTREWLIGWRNITNTTSNNRTFIASVMPRYGVGNSMNLGLPDAPPRKAACLAANLSALPFDFVVRQKLGGTNMSHFYTKQFPVFAPSDYSDEDEQFLVSRVLELTYTSHSMAPWAKDLGYSGAPFPWDENRRATLQAEINAFFSRKYGLTRDELVYILDPQEAMGEDFHSVTFPGLKRNEESDPSVGEYRTKRLVLEAWARMHPDNPTPIQEKLNAGDADV